MKIILLCGGKGKRLFPLSREHYPKQFIPIFNGKSLFELTLERFSQNDYIYVITNKISSSFLLDFRKKSKVDYKIIYEPVSKNTAASVEYGLQFFDDEDIIGVFPVDHLVNDIENFQKCIKKALEFVENSIVLIGIRPDRVETRFGYIEYKNYDVISFKEKPDYETAKKYIDSGNFLFNGGIFIFKKKVMQQEMKKHAIDIYNTGEEIGKQIKNNRYNFESNLNQFFPDSDLENTFFKFPSISIDYAVIEKTDKLKVIKSEFDWDDLGNIDALFKKIPSKFFSNFGIIDNVKESEIFEYCKKKDNDNVDENNQNKIIGLDGKSYGIIGYDDCNVIDTEDSLLIIKNGDSDDVEKFYNWIEKDKSKAEITKFHKTVLKPWGYYKNLYEIENKYKIKIIKINKGEQISLQTHQHREEYWTIIDGKGKIIIDDKEYFAEKGKQFFIPKNSRHQAIASEEEDLLFAEVQMGEILSEDDIIRIQDKYKR